MGIKIFALSVLVSILAFVVELVRRGKLTFKYAVGWLCMALMGTFFVVFDRVLYQIADWFGFRLPSNFIFFMLLCSFIALSFFLTIFLCQQNSRNDLMAQKIGLLELELKKIKEKLRQ